MIRVKVELCPGGDQSPEAVTEIGRMYVANVGGNRGRGEYDAAVCRRGTTAVPQPVNPGGPHATRSGHVSDYPREAYNVWRLISRSLAAAFPEERHPQVKTTAPEQVFRGLMRMAQAFMEGNATFTCGTHEEQADVEAARAWLAAALKEES